MLRSWMNTALRNRLQVATCLIGLLGIALADSTASPSQMLDSWHDDADLHDVVFVDAEYGWAVGDNGTVWHTQNGGEIWRRQPVPIACQLRTVHFVNRQRGWAAGGVAVPLTSMTQGVLLTTNDGGKTWQPTEGLLLPWITGIHFNDSKQGVAVGHASSMYPAGAWATNDGGRTWSPLPGIRGTHWLKHDFQSGNGQVSGLLKGHDGQIARLSNQRLAAVTPSARAPANDWSRPSFVSLVNATVYFAGMPTPSLTVDGGRAWQSIGEFAPDGIQRRMQFQTMARQAGHCWLAGSPGNRILHSADDGRTWRAVVAPASLPLQDLHFQSAQQGWAVGARGTILATRDGGQTWKRQRAGMKRDALLGIFADQRDIPWDLLAQASAVDELRTHIVLITTVSADTPIAHRLQDAAAKIGATAEVLTNAQLDATIDPPAERLIEHWQRQHVNAIDWLSENLTRIIRERRPDVVLSSERSDGRSGSGSQKLVGQLVADACEYAASVQVFVEQQQQLGLGAWSVSRVVKCIAKPSGPSISKSKRTTARGETPEQLAIAARRILNQPDSQAESESAWALQSLVDADAETDLGTQLFAGVVVEYDSAARRPRAPVVPRTATKRNLAIALSRLNYQGVQRVEQIERIAATKDQAGGILFDLASSEQNAAERDILWGQFVARHEEHPLVQTTLLKLVHRHASLERQWYNHSKHQVLPTAAVLAEVPVESTNEDANGGSTVQLVSAQTDAFQADWKAALAILQQIKSKRPMLYAEPEVAFSLAAIKRLDAPDSANSLMKQQQRIPTHWRHYARAELKLAGAGDNDQLTTWSCKSSSSRPLLDGDLGDEIWQTTAFKQLGINRSQPTLIGLAKDDQYLYLAGYCPKRPGVAYHPIRKKRPRDADLRDHDRIQFNLDVNRDYQSWWTLAFDSRGWTMDQLNSDTSWNPKYYVASKSDEKVWAIEVAIPLDELAPTKYQQNSYWAIGVERTVPGWERERWNAAEVSDNPPHLQGILHLE